MNDQNARAVIVEEWIQKNGPLPNKYGEEVRQILMDGQEEQIQERAILIQDCSSRQVIGKLQAS